MPSWPTSPTPRHGRGLAGGQSRPPQADKIRSGAAYDNIDLVEGDKGAEADLERRPKGSPRWIGASWACPQGGHAAGCGWDQGSDGWGQCRFSAKLNFMETKVVQVRGRGTITLPAKMRERYGLTDGDPISVLDLNGVLVLSPKVGLVPKLAAEIERLRTQAGVSLEDLLDGQTQERDPS